MTSPVTELQGAQEDFEAIAKSMGSEAVAASLEALERTFHREAAMRARKRTK